MTKRFLTVVLALVFMIPAMPAFSETKVVFVDEERGIFEQDIALKDRCISYYAPSPFELNVVADSIIAGVSFGGFLSANIVRALETFPEYEAGTVYDRSLVPAIDSWAMNPYNGVLDKIATATSIFDAATPVIAYGFEFLFKNLPKKDGISLAVMYLETLFAANAVKETIKINALRVRPYMYFDAYDESAIRFHDFEFSLPSGHTMNAFAGATFLSYTFCQYYPYSNWRIPVIAVSYGIAVGTGIMRIASGNHFFTDVLAGAGIGSAFGFLVPFAHTFIAKLNRNLEEQSKLNGTPRVELAALPMGLNMTVHF